MAKGTGAQPFLAGAIVAKKYRLLRPIGEGATGVVWHARNELIGGEVALKLIVCPEPALRARLLDEAKACCAVDHENVVQVHDVGETDSGDMFLEMELLEGETLADVLLRRGRLEVGEAAAIGCDVAWALAAVHGKGLVHGDLRPANVFLHHEPGEVVPAVKVLDFGLNESLVGPSGVRTIAGATVGTPHYTSPEQARADAAVDGRTDVWSLGAVLFEMLSGVRPFEGDGMEVLEKVVHGPIPLLWQKVRRVPPELSGLVTACLRRDREHRPWPASEIARRLERFAGVSPGSPPLVEPLLPPPPASPPVSAAVLPPDMASPALSEAPGDAGVPPGGAGAPGRLRARLARRTKAIVTFAVTFAATSVLLAAAYDARVSPRERSGEESVRPEWPAAPEPSDSPGLDALRRWQVTGVGPLVGEARDARAAPTPVVRPCRLCGKFDRKGSCCPKLAPKGLRAR